MSEQPQADALCPACGHYGFDHLKLLDMPPRCHCGCVDWSERFGVPDGSYRRAVRRNEPIPGVDLWDDDLT